MPNASHEPRWDLSSLYAGPDDPRLAMDLAAVAADTDAFRAAYAGKLGDRLGEALAAYERLSARIEQIGVYAFLLSSTDMRDAKAQSLFAEAQNRLAAIGAGLVFFEHEILELDEVGLDGSTDATVRRLRPWINQIRRDKTFHLPEAVETALASRSPFGPSSWAHFFDEMEAEHPFPFEGKTLTQAEVLDVMSRDADPARRFAAMRTVNEVLKGHLGDLSAQTLSQIVQAKAVEDRERGYKHPMEARNRDNRVSDAAVEALHAAVEDAAPLVRRFYKLKAKLLGLPILRWSDRNASVGSGNDALAYADALALVRDAYASFSPTLRGLVDSVIDGRQIDVPAAPGKRGGAYNCSFVRPDREPASFVFLNYVGSTRDAMTLAHELGHAVHGLLAGRAQGPLMAGAPIALCETASVFGEMTTYVYLRDRLRQEGKHEELLRLAMGKLDDMLNTVVRQVAFSQFERAVHAQPRRWSPEELDALWIRVTKRFYGEEGDAFAYGDMERLWAYISHFHRPFYVYGYAFGELLTQSLYAKRETLGDRFEPLYLEALKAGGTKDAKALFAPFGLDVEDPAFWRDGIRAGMGALLEEAEALAAKIRP